MTFLLDASVSRYRRPLKIRLCMRNKILKSGTLNNVKSNFSFNEINKKDLYIPPWIGVCLSFTVFFFFFFFFALLHKFCYSLHKTKRHFCCDWSRFCQITGSPSALCVGSGFRGHLVGIQLFRERLSEKMCSRQSRKVIWDMISTLFLATVAVEPTFVAFH